MYVFVFFFIILLLLLKKWYYYCTILSGLNAGSLWMWLKVYADNYSEADENNIPIFPPLVYFPQQWLFYYSCQGSKKETERERERQRKRSSGTLDTLESLNAMTMPTHDHNICQTPLVDFKTAIIPQMYRQKTGIAAPPSRGASLYWEIYSAHEAVIPDSTEGC